MQILEYNSTLPCNLANYYRALNNPKQVFNRTKTFNWRATYAGVTFGIKVGY